MTHCRTRDSIIECARHDFGRLEHVIDPNVGEHLLSGHSHTYVVYFCTLTLHP